MRKTRLATSLAALAALALGSSGAPVSAQSAVPVTLQNTTAARTLYVESMTGQSLSSLDFGSVRSLPFRVRVVDSSFTRTPFTVSATMTNLYLDSGGLQYGTKIPATNVSLDSQVNPLNVLGVSAAVQPLVNTVTTLTGVDAAICTVLGLATPLVNGLPTCSLTTTGLSGVVQNLNVPVNLSVLSNLPLLPQANQIGPFTFPEFGAGTVGAGDTVAKAAATSAGQIATPLRVVGGAPVSTSAVLSALQGALATTPLASLVPTESVTAALNAQFPAAWGNLSTAQVNTILAQTVGAAQTLTGLQVLSQTGTYISLPTLNVNVPGGVPAGQYKGTLVVTALQ